MSQVFILGISGGSGSGKTTFAELLNSRLHESFGESVCSVLAQDSYYIDQSSRFDHDGGSVNFDHPDAIDFELLGHHLFDLKRGKSVEVPIYDFKTHSRLDQVKSFDGREIILVDGTLILSQECVRNVLDLSVFIDTPEQLRFDRRLRRDIEERGRTPEGVHKQFYSQVKPMHDLFVGPSMDHADFCASDLLGFDTLLDQMTSMLSQMLQQNRSANQSEDSNLFSPQ